MEALKHHTHFYTLTAAPLFEHIDVFGIGFDMLCSWTFAINVYLLSDYWISNWSNEALLPGQQGFYWQSQKKKKKKDVQWDVNYADWK